MSRIFLARRVDAKFEFRVTWLYFSTSTGMKNVKNRHGVFSLWNRFSTQSSSEPSAKHVAFENE
jgi:hypothetical protein